MKKLSWGGVVVGVLALFAISDVRADVGMHSKAFDPIYWYEMGTGPVGQKFESPAAALAAYQAEQNLHPDDYFVVSNPQPLLGSAHVNGLPGSWTWDYTRVYRFAPSQNYSGTTGVIGLSQDCPALGPNEGFWEKKVDYSFVPDVGFECVKTKPIPVSLPKTCQAPKDSLSALLQAPKDGVSTPNPVLLATGDKYFQDADHTDNASHPLHLTRGYLSSGNFAAGIGLPWWHSHAYKLTHTKGTPRIIYVPGTRIPNGVPPKPAPQPTVTIQLGSGDTVAFTQINSPSGTQWKPDWGSDTLSQTSSGFTYRATEEDRTYAFNTLGQLQTITERNGWVMAYSYNSAGQLTQVRNQFGRTLGFAYTAGLLTQVTTPDGKAIRYSYDGSGRLQVVTYPDASTRGFYYENGTFPKALTGIAINGVRYATYAYDAQGRAITTQHAGGVERYQVAYQGTTIGDPVTVTDPLGTQRYYNYNTQGGKVAVLSASSPSGLGLSDASSRIQNIQGLIESERDFNGVETLFSWDTTRRLPLSTTSANNQAEAQTTTYQWHPTYRVPTQITESGQNSTATRTTTYTYDPAGNPLTQTLTDPSTGKTYTTTTTYTAQGLVASETAPNGAKTSYTYDTAGNPLTITNALGHVNKYTYDGAGRVLTHTAPNGLITTYTYDPRGRILSINRGSTASGLITKLTYTPSGQVASVSLPHGHTISYSYDAAQRQTSWSDNRGNTASYTLDPMGNRTSEIVKNSSGTPIWQIARTINAINRVQTQTLGGGATTPQTSTYQYDANGELINITSATQTLQLGLDALRRPINVYDGTSSKTLAFDALDHLTSATDGKGVATTYTPDALGNPSTETSSDIGGNTTPSTINYDALGLPSRITNALGQATTIQRDVLGRPTTITYADGQTTTLVFDTNQKGYLAQIIDKHATGATNATTTTTYTRDTLGRVTQKTQTLANASTQTLKYTYTAGGQLATIVYPRAGTGTATDTLQYVYNPSGQITQLNWNGAAILTGITWNALGQPLGWKWAFTDSTILPSKTATFSASRSYNTAGQQTANEVASYTYDADGHISSLTQKLRTPATTKATDTTTTEQTARWSVTYDPAGRITGFTPSAPAVTATSTLNPQSTTYGYDGNGNRLSSNQTQPTPSATSPTANTTTSRDYQYNEGNNRLTHFTQTLANAQGQTSTQNTYSLDAQGQLLSDGLRNYGYDAQGRLSDITTTTNTGTTTTRYAHNALGQRIFKTEPQYSTAKAAGVEESKDLGLIDTLVNFFTNLWNPIARPAEKQGYAYLYDEEGTLLAEYGSGGVASAGNAKYIYLPTATGPQPVLTIQSDKPYAVHADHLNTPRRLTQADGQVAWQWAYSAFGDEAPTTAANRFTSPSTNPTTGTTAIKQVTFNLRYPGQYADAESNLFYNYFRSYDPKTGRYTQADPIGLNGGFNRFLYANGNPLSYTDPSGLCGFFTTVCAWALANAPWVVPAGVAVAEGGAMIASGAVSPGSVAPAVGVNAAKALSQTANAANLAITVEQYALRVNQSGFYPVMTRGAKEATEMKWCTAGEVWKFGTTRNPTRRYSQSYLDNIGEYGVSYSKEFSGTLTEALTLENMKIRNFLSQTGVLPPGNKIIK
jgi:RHS repeat-associated protein